MRKTGQKAELDAQGRLTFERDGQQVRIDDPEIGRQYMQLQASYREVLNDRLDQLKGEAFNEFGEQYLSVPNFGIEDVRAGIAIAPEGTTKTRLENLRDVTGL